MNNVNITIPAAMLARLMDSASNLADYVAEEQRSPEASIMIARDELQEVLEEITTLVMTRRFMEA